MIMKWNEWMGHANMNKKFWKALACGIGMVTFTGAVSMAEDIQVKPIVTFINHQEGMPVGIPFPIGDHYTKGNLFTKTKGTESIPHLTYINSREGHFRFAIPWDVQTITWIDKVVPTDSGHIVGILVQLDTDVNVMVSRRDNVPPKGVSQEEWNTTWYDRPIQGMTDVEYMEIWRRENPHTFEKRTVSEGGLLSREDMTAVRWERFEQPTMDGPYVRFTIDMIMKKDPIHRYLMEVEYDDIHRYDLQTLLHLLDNFVYTGTTESQEKNSSNRLSQVLSSMHDIGALQVPKELMAGNTMSVSDVTNLEGLYHEELVSGKSSKRTKKEVRITDEGITSQSNWDDNSKTEAQIQRSGQIRLEKKQ